MIEASEVGAFHSEVLGALRAVAPDGDVGERIRIDRGSSIDHLGVRTPVRRKLVKDGFSFSSRTDSEQLVIWDGVWAAATCADVLFAVLDHYRERLKRSVPYEFWPVAVHWIDKVDNWAHADDLARVYARTLAAHHDQVYPDLARWSGDDRLWHRRISIVSLIHYTGKNAVFLGPEHVFPLLENCLTDDRPEIQKSIGWVLREMATVYPAESIDFMTTHRDRLSAVAVRRATERMEPDVAARIRAG